MSSLPLHLPSAHPPRLSVPRPFPSFAELRGWSLAAMLLVSVAVLSLNLAWMTALCELLLFLAAGVLAVAAPAATAPQRMTPVLLAACIPLWGALQMLLGHSAYGYASLLAVLYCTTVPACLLLGMLLLREHAMRDAFLASLWPLAAAVTALELYQLLILGRYTTLASGLPLMSSNLYAELAELLLPAVLATALRQGSRLWLGCGLAAVLLGTTVAAGARMGTALELLEIVAVLLATRSVTGYRKLTWRRHGTLLVVMLLAVLALEGTSYLGARFAEANPLEGRSEVLHSALTMARQHPLTGFGAGAFAVVYPEYAHLDTASFVNHAHNDYVELAVDGGLPLLVLWLALLALCLPAVCRSPWALGVCAILVHGLSDFPLYRLPVLALAMLLTAAAQTRLAGRAERSQTRSSGGGLQSPRTAWRRRRAGARTVAPLHHGHANVRPSLYL